MTSPRGRSSPSVSERGRGACAATVVLAVALGFAAPAAWAAPPPASGTFNYDVSLTVNTFPAGHSFACGTVSIDAAPLPTVSAIGSGGCTSVLQAIFGYYVEIVGPTNVLVPITVASTATLSANGLAQAGFSLGVGSQTIGIGNCYFASLTACGAHSTSTSMVMMTNQLYSVGMMADVSNFLGDGTGSAVVDPQFFFDGNFGPDYTFVFSPGVGNGVTVGVVPEPETLALMLAGLAAGSIALRRRRGIRI
jgi:hypothetical protein